MSTPLLTIPKPPSALDMARARRPAEVVRTAMEQDTLYQVKRANCEQPQPGAVQLMEAGIRFHEGDGDFDEDSEIWWANKDDHAQTFGRETVGYHEKETLRHPVGYQWFVNLFPRFRVSWRPPDYGTEEEEHYEEYHTFDGGSEIVERTRVKFREGEYTCKLTATAKLLNKNEQTVGSFTFTIKVRAHAKLTYHYPAPTSPPYYDVTYAGPFNPTNEFPMDPEGEILELDGEHTDVNWTYALNPGLDAFNGIKFEISADEDGDLPEEEVGAEEGDPRCVNCDVRLEFLNVPTIDLMCVAEPEEA